MITYEYECERCKHRFEVEQRITDPALTECQELLGIDGVTYCRGPLKRLIGAPAFVLKGAGWAKDGYGSKK